MYDIVPYVPKGFKDGLMIVGEAPGKDEVKANAPFVGKAGKELKDALREAGINDTECVLTNVFLNRPTKNSNDVMFYFADKEHEEVQGISTYRGCYLKPKGFEQYSRLQHEIRLLKPKAIVALGRTAMWFFLERDPLRVNDYVGTTTKYLGIKVFMTWHPSYTMRTQRAHGDLVQSLKEAKEYINVTTTTNT